MTSRAWKTKLNPLPHKSLHLKSNSFSTKPPRRHHAPPTYHLHLSRTTTVPRTPPITYLNHQHFSLFLHTEFCLINHFNHFINFSELYSNFLPHLGILL